MIIPQPDIITLYKSNGTTISDIAAWVQSKVIFINDADLPIEEGDVIERILPNGMPEKYIVVDRGYFSRPDPHYQVKIIKQSPVLFENIPSTVIHQHGDNPRVNINSADFSSNIINKVDLSNFEEIKQLFNNQISDDNERTRCLKSLDELKESVGEKSYLEKYKQFIEVVADHMGVIGPFIPYLTAFIH